MKPTTIFDGPETSRLVTCAGEAALEVASAALASFEHANAHDTVSAAADLAAKAFDELASHSDVSISRRFMF